MNEEKIWLIVMFGYPDSSSLAFNEILFACDTETERAREKYHIKITNGKKNSTFHSSQAKKKQDKCYEMNCTILNVRQKAFAHANK